MVAGDDGSGHGCVKGPVVDKRKAGGREKGISRCGCNAKPSLLRP